MTVSKAVLLFLLTLPALIGFGGLSNECVHRMVVSGINGFVKDLLLAYDVFRVHELHVCGMDIFYSIKRIDITEKKLDLEYSLGSYDNNDYFWNV